jgi:hypothetical protein
MSLKNLDIWIDFTEAFPVPEAKIKVKFSDDSEGICFYTPYNRYQKLWEYGDKNHGKRATHWKII